MMKKLKIVLFLSAVVALSVGGFVNSQIENGIELQSIEQLMTFNKAVAGDESGGCSGYPYSFLCLPNNRIICCEEEQWGYLGEKWTGW